MCEAEINYEREKSTEVQHKRILAIIENLELRKFAKYTLHKLLLSKVYMFTFLPLIVDRLTQEIKPTNFL